jgi:flagellar biosynthesis chaperone FliJ
MAADGKARRQIQSLLEILAKEKAALQSGAYERIRMLAGEKERMLHAILNSRIDDLAPDSARNLSRALDELQKKAAENATMLAAVKAGVEDARRRIEGVDDKRSSSGLYAEHGEPLGGARPCAVTRSV